MFPPNIGLQGHRPLCFLEQLKNVEGFGKNWNQVQAFCRLLGHHFAHLYHNEFSIGINCVVGTQSMDVFCSPSARILIAPGSHRGNEARERPVRGSFRYRQSPTGRR